MPIKLEGPVALAELPNGNKLMLFEVGPGVHYQVEFTPEAANNLGAALQGKSVLVPPPGLFGPNGSPT